MVGVRVERDGPACLVILDWPERKNALGPQDADAISQALQQAALAPDVHGVVLTGEGAFCAGVNLKDTLERAAMSPEERRQMVYRSFQGLMRTLIAVPVPTIAAIDGPAVGSGFDLALACDSRFIGPAGWCMQGWGRLGFVPGTGGELLMRRLAPNALWSVLEAQPRIGADLAEKLGLGEASGEMSARQRAVTRVAALAKSLSRQALEAYVELYRSELRTQLEPHLEAAREHQVHLQVAAGLRKRVESVLGKAT